VTVPSALRAPGDFGGQCLIGECELAAELLMPATTYFGFAKTGSYLYGTWRDADGNLLRALRGVETDETTMRTLFVARPQGQLERDERASDSMWSGPSMFERSGDEVTIRSVDASSAPAFEFIHRPDGCRWSDGDAVALEGTALGPAIQWYNSWPGGGCFSATGKYRARGTVLGRAVEGFVGHEIHYFSPGATWFDSPFGRGREICWQQVANEYADGTTVQGTFAYGADGWRFAMLHDEQGAFHATTDVAVEATVRENGYPESIRYRFLDQSWTWRIDPQGERAMLFPSPMRGADGTCTRDGDDREVRASMGNSDWWTDGRAAPIIRAS
jgi:hypothetical protein